MAHARPRRPRPKFRRKCRRVFAEVSKKWANFADFCEKLKKFSKNFSSFLHTFRTRSQNLSISKGRSPIRARVRTQAGEIKTSESRHASIRQKSGWLDSRATSWRRPNASCWSRTSHSVDADIRARDPDSSSGLRTHGPLRQGRRHTRRAPACRSSRSRERTVAFAAAGRHLRKIEQTSKKTVTVFLLTDTETE